VLLSFRFANFRSFKDEQEFSFVHGSYTTPMEAPSGADDPRPWDDRVGTVAGLYGANASGKSNVLKALNFMQEAVRDSYQNWSPGTSVPADPFRLDPALKDEPSLFEVNFVIGGVRYQYGFRLTRSHVAGEWLYAYPSTRRQIWFERDISVNEEYYFGKNFPGRNRVIADLTRPNCLFLSTAAANNHPRVEVVDRWFRAHLRDASPEDRSALVFETAGMSRQDETWQKITELMKFADLGISTTRVRREKMAPAERKQFLEYLRAAGRDTDDNELSQWNQMADRLSEVVEFGHSSGGDRQPVYLPIAEESLGTQTWFSLVGPVIHAINDGDTLMVDELDASLHPRLTSELLRIFREPAKNPKQAQIMFTTHDTTLLGSLLGERELLRDQVWFTEKQGDGSSTLYPLTDFAPRTTENLERGYLQGRYGAVPFLDDKILGDILDQADTGEKSS
jgi:energy-coupling factor transporter ATP-binding protein EcfA2